ncbi:MAG: hypothetical protein OXI15_25535, partial [Chromatiales bacterium]|nr:hypothetical protein [Chromatiales bacterium]
MTSLFVGRGTKERIAPALAPGDVDEDRRVRVMTVPGPGCVAFGLRYSGPGLPAPAAIGARHATATVPTAPIPPGCASAAGRGVTAALHGVRRLGRAAAPALLLLTLLAGVTTQASAQTLPTVSFALDWQNTREGSGTHNVEVWLNPAPTADITVKYTVGGTATAGSDFTIANSGTLTVSKGATTATIPVTIIDDSVADVETVILKLAGGTDYQVSNLVGTHALIVWDNEPNVSLASASRRVGEGSGTHDVEVRLSPAPTTDITLN